MSIVLIIELFLENINLFKGGLIMKNDNYYEQIKSLFISNEITRKVKNYSINKSDLETYYNIGRLIIEAQGGEERAKYGDKIIKEYSKKLITELNNKKYSYRNLMNMRKFYLVFKNEKVNALRSQLSWSHYRELLPINDFEKIKYYIEIAINSNLSYRQLRERIKSQEYERLPDKTKNKLMDNDNNQITDFVKNPIVIKNTNKIEYISEKVLQKLIMEDIPSFLEELGDGFTFIKNEYKIKFDNTYNYIDLLLYNIKYRCYVVVELKVTELKKEHTGQIMTYMNYIDKNIKTIDDNKTVGIIICKKNNNYVIEYCSDERIISREYKFV